MQVIIRPTLCRSACFELSAFYCLLYNAKAYFLHFLAINLKVELVERKRRNKGAVIPVRSKRLIAAKSEEEYQYFLDSQRIF